MAPEAIMMEHIWARIVVVGNAALGSAAVSIAALTDWPLAAAVSFDGLVVIRRFEVRFFSTLEHGKILAGRKGRKSAGSPSAAR